MSTTSSRPTAQAAIHLRIDRLSPESVPRWGTMSAREMVCHVADQLRVAIGDLDAEPDALRLRFGGREVQVPPGLLRYRSFRQLLVHRVPWPKSGFGGPPEMFTTSPGRWPDDIAALHALVNRMARKNPAAEWGIHPVFGRVSGREWRLLSRRHLDHHFRQFGV